MNAYLAARNLRNDTYTIYAEYSHYPRIKRVTTGVKVNQKYWDNTLKQIKANGTPNVKKDNDHLKAVLSGLNGTIKQLYTANGNLYPTIEQLNKHLSSVAETVAAIATEEPLVNELQKFINGQNDWALATSKGFNTLTSNITAFQQAKKVTWYLSSLSNEDIKDWQEWLLETYDYNNATLGKRVRLIRQFLRDAQPANVNMSKVSPLHKQMLTPPVVLNLTEIEAIRALKLEFSPRLERTRDLMIAQIFSGLRFSDLIRLEKHHIQKNHIVIRQQKTRKAVTIPVFKQFQEVVAKYTNEQTGELELPRLSNQKFNEYIKEVCEFVPVLRENIIVEFKKRNLIDEKEVRKLELISSHSSRRSFCSLCLDLGYSVKETMAWSGHKTLQAFSRYIGQTDVNEAAADDFATRYAAKLAK